MYEIHLNSVFSSKSLDELKLLSLYYDKIHIIDDATFSPGYDDVNKEVKIIRHSFVPDTFNDDYKILIEEGILEITEAVESNAFAREVSGIINKSEDVIFPVNPEGHKILLPEVINILTDVKKNKIDRDGVDTNFLWWYYAKKLQFSVNTILEGKTCISSSKTIDILLNEFINKNQERFK